jgi:hypothetical protein
MDVATVAHPDLKCCDGFRVESPIGLLGWVEEPWLSASGEPTALAVRMVDGRRALLLVGDVTGVEPEREEVFAREHGALLELGAPRVEAIDGDGGAPTLVASWRTTGATLEPPSPPGLVRRTALAVRPWRLAPPPPEGADPPWQSIALMLLLVTTLVCLEIALAFGIAYLVTGRAY